MIWLFIAEPVAYHGPAYQYDNNAGIIRTMGAILVVLNTIQHRYQPASYKCWSSSGYGGANIGYSINDKVELQAGWAGGDVADLFGGDFDVEDIVIWCWFWLTSV
jgi:hypothetical protein